MNRHRKPFPRRRTDTITRGNIVAATMNPGVETPYEVAKWIMGGTHGGLVTRRHIRRAENLMSKQPDQVDSAASA